MGARRFAVRVDKAAGQPELRATVGVALMKGAGVTVCLRTRSVVAVKLFVCETTGTNLILQGT